MSEITNKEVFDALTSCIDGRWRWHSLSPTGYSGHAANSCALCHLFDGGNYSFTKPSEECHRCPVFLMNNGKGCADGSSFMRWADNHNKTNDKRVLSELVAARVYFFGDWKQ